MSDFKLSITCEQFEDRISDYIDGMLSPGDRVMMDTHASQCAPCSAALAEVSAIVRDAAAMPLLAPSRDLWAGIVDRLDTPVVSIATSKVRATKTHPAVSFRMFAAAAVLLVTVSSGATYWLTRAQSEPTAGAPQLGSNASQVATSAGAESLTTTFTPALVSAAAGNVVAAKSNIDNGAAPELSLAGRSRTRYAANDGNAAELVYEREIIAMRRIVDERLGDLDSNTVVEIERNLRIIDKAIGDSRRALQNDPRSRFLSSQLDRALENKLDILRRLALL
ncbi:MAG: zf-HC2 domain-containing protein [Gemmatimonadaceae bacterium]